MGGTGRKPTNGGGAGGDKVKCPKCGGDMHQVFFGDEVTRWRCMQCDLIYSSVEWIVGDGEMVRMGYWRRGERPKQAAAREG